MKRQSVRKIRHNSTGWLGAKQGFPFGIWVNYVGELLRLVF